MDVGRAGRSRAAETARNSSGPVQASRSSRSAPPASANPLCTAGSSATSRSKSSGTGPKLTRARASSGRAARAGVPREPDGVRSPALEPRTGPGGGVPGDRAGGAVGGRIARTGDPVGGWGGDPVGGQVDGRCDGRGDDRRGDQSRVQDELVDAERRGERPQCRFAEFDGGLLRAEQLGERARGAEADGAAAPVAQAEEAEEVVRPVTVTGTCQTTTRAMRVLPSAGEGPAGTAPPTLGPARPDGEPS